MRYLHGNISHTYCSKEKASKPPYFMNSVITRLFRSASFARLPALSRQAPAYQPIPRLMASSMSLRLSKKTILITGASSGIGKSTALEFARTAPDCRLILTARRESALEELKSTIEQESANVSVLVYKLDVANPNEVGGIVEKLPPGWREVDVLINNAYAPPLSPSNQPTNFQN